MTIEANKALVRRYWDEVWNAGRLDLLPELFAPQHVAGQRSFVGQTLAAFAGSRVVIADLLAEGDKVVTRYDWTAAHTGVWDMELNGLSMAVPPTGQPIWDRGIAFSRVEGGKIVDMPSVWTMLELAQQLGAVTLPGREPPAPSPPPTSRPSAGAVPPPPEAAKALVLRYLEGMGTRHDLAVADGLFAPDFHIAPSAPPGPAGVKDLIRRLLAAFPDLRVEVHELVAEADRVAAHLTLAGTHRGEWAGAPATGRPVAIREMHIYRVEGGTLAERWFEVDRLGLMQQLGLLPMPDDAAS